MAIADMSSGVVDEFFCCHVEDSRGAFVEETFWCNGSGRIQS